MGGVLQSGIAPNGNHTMKSTIRPPHTYIYHISMGGYTLCIYISNIFWYSGNMNTSSSLINGTDEWYWAVGTPTTNPLDHQKNELVGNKFALCCLLLELFCCCCSAQSDMIWWRFWLASGCTLRILVTGRPCSLISYHLMETNQRITTAAVRGCWFLRLFLPGTRDLSTGINNKKKINIEKPHKRLARERILDDIRTGFSSCFLPQPSRYPTE